MKTKVNPQKIKKARHKLGLTQPEAASVIGAATRTWQDWEAGARNMPLAKWELFVLKTGLDVAKND
jgi:DNA-binding transcriptional regulator YiaG